MSETTESLIAYRRANARICPGYRFTNVAQRLMVDGLRIQGTFLLGGRSRYNRAR